MIGRRGFLIGMGALIAAPAIVRVTSIMPVKSYRNVPIFEVDDLVVYGRSPAMLAIADLEYVNGLIKEAFEVPFRFLPSPFPTPLDRAIITDAFWRGMPGNSA